MVSIFSFAASAFSPVVARNACNCPIPGENAWTGLAQLPRLGPICPDRRYRLSRSRMNHLRKLGIASFVLLGLGLVTGALPRSATGWTPQTAATLALICYGIGLILALIAFMQSRRGQSLDSTTKFLARAPLALVTIGVLFFFLRAMIMG